MTFEEAVTKALLPMESVLDTFGKKVDANVVRGWCMALSARGVTDPDLIGRTAAWFLANATSFPKPAEFADRAVRLRGPTHEAIGVECPDGSVRIEVVPIGSRKSLRGRSATPEEMAQLRARLGAVMGKVVARG
ncbi:MAG: hypothetical protein K1X67_07945 [Fimbriimonadaceae bacterium]|nr:hypothetical protein [Fimbriimonadaceae bacterium]